MRVVVCSRRDGGVSVIHYAEEHLREFRVGVPLDASVRGRTGFCQFLAARMGEEALQRYVARDFALLGLARAWEIEKLVRDPDWRPDRRDRVQIATRWVDGRMLGGVEEAEALRIITDKDAPAFSTAHEVVDARELPDRWFRNAWRRSPNGGPIVIDLEAARGIQFARIRTQHRQARLKRWAELQPQEHRPINWGGIRSAIERAGDVEELRHIWPHGLPVA